MPRFNFITTIRTSIGRRIQSAFNSGSIEGVLYIDGAPAPAGEWVGCNFIVSEEDDAFTFDDKRQKNFSGGRFRISRVPVGEVGVGRCHCDIDGWPNDVERRVEVRKGETTFVEIGKAAGHIKGQFVFPEGLASIPTWGDLPLIWMECLSPNPEPDEGRVLEYSGDWRRLFFSPDTWKQDDKRWYLVRVDDNGAFEVSGIHPGHYGLSIEAGEQYGGGLLGPSAVGFHDFPVDSGASGVLEVGKVVLPLAALVERGTGNLEGVFKVDGAPAAAGTRVKCEVTLDYHDEYPNLRLQRCWFSLDEDRMVTTDDAGRFSFRDLPAGSAHVGMASEESEEEPDGDLHVQMMKGETVFVEINVASV